MYPTPLPLPLPGRAPALGRSLRGLRGPGCAPGARGAFAGGGGVARAGDQRSLPGRPRNFIGKYENL